MHTYRYLYILMLVATLTNAKEHLSPEQSQFTGIFMPDYYGMVIDALSEAYDKDVIVRAMVLPSFSQEYALGVRKHSNEFRIFAVWPEKKLWGYKTLALMNAGAYNAVKDGKEVKDTEGIRRLEKKYPANYKDVPLERCSEEITPEIANTIAAVWESMLLGTRYKKGGARGFDGTTYHFSMKVDYEEIAGKVWSPKPDSKTGKLVTLTDAMLAFCKENTTVSQEILTTALHESKSVLKSANNAH